MTGLAQPASPLSVGSLTQLTLSLLAIVALIFALSWVLKRFKMTAPRGRGDMVVMDEVSVGPRERVVLVRVGDRQVLIGVGSGGIVGLTPLVAPVALRVEAAAPAFAGAVAGAFADRLRDFMKRQGVAP